MTTTTQPAGATPTPILPPGDGRDRSTYGGMLAVAVAAAVLSFSALAGLAALAGVNGAVPLPAGGGFRLAWLLPIAVDAYAVTATRVWLRTAGTGRTRRYARRNAVGAIALSVLGNGVFHALTAAGVASLAEVRAGWVVVVAVSAVPPVMLGLVGHLHALVSDDHRHPNEPAEPAAVAVVPAGERDASAPAAPDASHVDARRVAPAAGDRRDSGAGTGTRRPARTAGRTGTRAGTRTGTRAPARTDAELAAVLAGLPREPDGTVPIRRATAAAGCGPDRARRLLAATDLLRTAPAATPAPAELAPATATTTTATPDDPAGAAAPIAA